LAGELPERHVVTCFLECDGEILILRRSQQVGSFRGRWAGVSGYVETTADEQTLKEIQEETGLNPEELSLVRKGRPLKVRDEEFRFVWVVHPYLFQIKNRGKVRIDWEHSDQRWIKPGEIDSYDTVPMLKEALAKVYQP
jgi:8-oxo-dGTP diphosphatase